MDFSWPGNIRAIDHAFVICEGEYIDMFDLPVEIRQFEYRPTSITLPTENIHTVRHQRDKLVRDYLLEILASSNWNKAEVSQRIGLSRAAVWKYMKKWNIPLKQPS
jgi:transcriptional regulator of acetoin/glycerol metabolism